MSDHGWGGEWPEELEPESDGGLDPDTPDLGADLGGGLDPDFGEAGTADLGGFDHRVDPLADDFTGAAGADHEPADALDPAGDSTVDLPGAFGSPGDGIDAGPAGDSGGELGVTPVGADPDAHADTWADQSFPEPLGIDAPEPVNGLPWADPATLGAEPLPDPDAGYQGAPQASELASYAGEQIPAGADPWRVLSASEDPATSSLARWWSPGT